MIPLYKKITVPSFFSYSSSLESPPEFDTPWHYHPEYELILIMNCGGTRFMGDNISEFNEIELMLIGPDLPHFWRDHHQSKDSYACVIHFSEDFLGDKLLSLPEASKIRELLEDSKLGIAFEGTINRPVMEKIEWIVKQGEGFGRIVDLLEALHLLANNPTYRTLSSEGFVKTVNKKNSDKVNAAIEFATNNFKEKISLQDVANSVYMSKPSFCRFFKRSTGKTYFDFIREIRIGHSCKLIVENNHSITQIGFECGYKNISNFNRQFRSVKGMVPTNYKKSVITNFKN